MAVNGAFTEMTGYSALEVAGREAQTYQEGMRDLSINASKELAGKIPVPKGSTSMLDIGGSMDPYVRVCEELFSAAKTEFKHLEYFYFHNFIYESVWKDNLRRHGERIPMYDVLRKYTPDYKIVFVGDATMSPYEIVQPGGSVEHWNEEAGAVWMQRLMNAYPHLVWFNPDAEQRWEYTPSVGIVQKLIGADRMFPLTLSGLEQGMRRLGH